MSEFLAPATRSSTLGVKNDANWRRREFYPAVERSGVQQHYTKKITPREFRAAAASAYGHARETELSARAQLGHSADSTTLGFYFAAYGDPDPELRGKPVEWQLQRARRLTLEWMEGELARLAQARIGSQGVSLKWEKQAEDVWTADWINSTRYAIWRDGAWCVSLGRSDADDASAGKAIATGLRSRADAEALAEAQAAKRQRQSLTVQRQRLERQIEHLRVLVAEQTEDEQAA